MKKLNDWIVAIFIVIGLVMVAGSIFNDRPAGYYEEGFGIEDGSSYDPRY